MKSERDERKELEDYAAEESFHRREWLVQRIGWAALAVLLVAACAGLLGNGPFAHRTVVAEKGLFRIDRFARRDAPTEWIVESGPDIGARSDLKLTVSAPLFARVKIDSVTPTPQEQIATTSGMQFIFHAGPEAHIVFHVEPQYVGWIKGEFQLNDSHPVTIEQFVYP